MSESSRFFEGSSKLHDSLRTLAKQLDALGIQYAVMATRTSAAQYLEWEARVEVDAIYAGAFDVEGG